MKSRTTIHIIIILILIAIVISILTSTGENRKESNSLKKEDTAVQAKVEQLRESLLISSDDTANLEIKFGAGQEQLNMSRDELEQYQQQLMKYRKYVPDKFPTKTHIISQGYLPENDHYAYDFAAAKYDTIFAAGAGVIESTAVNDRVYGTTVLIDHLIGFKTFYGHNDVNLVKPGDVVEKGQPIATVGMSGKSTAPHLHFAVIYKTKSIDPGTILKNK